MASRAIWSSEAVEDLTEAYFFLGADSPAAADRLVDAIEAAIRFLLDNPRAGAPRSFRAPRARGVRSWAPRRFPNHLIFYRPTDKGLEILRILHGARDLPAFLGDMG
ncbi:MAG: type II toxin-antitoxin system RelE/ParE family toxin [Planctomycetes bacterium]|nr:type II toxin-antitoxin system RelE/ParE family toxin [Planctomycetota bacterium]